MRLSVVCSLVIFVNYAFAVITIPVPDNARELYEQFKRDYGKIYTNEDDLKRFAIFKDNLVRAQKYQLNDRGTARYGVTRFSDLTPEEFATNFLSSRINNEVERVKLNDLDAVPNSLDWLSRVYCLYFAQFKQLVDCDQVDSGCNGGYPPETYKEIVRMGGLELQKDYPYHARDEECQLDKSKLLAKIDDSIVLEADEKKQAAYLAKHGPLSVALNANYLQFYQSGISHPTKSMCPPEQLNHAVLSVGYGYEDGVPYWIIKNSWSENWGEEVSCEWCIS
ncbi:hypothetical protein AHF37_11679 [Paragonimus kellicotti]|nr:hypothetical protein AHF37_11679 [Paragonimus kellicotti]